MCKRPSFPLWQLPRMCPTNPARSGHQGTSDRCPIIRLAAGRPQYRRPAQKINHTALWTGSSAILRASGSHCNQTTTRPQNEKTRIPTHKPIFPFSGLTPHSINGRRTHALTRTSFLCVRLCSSPAAASSQLLTHLAPFATPLNIPTRTAFNQQISKYSNNHSPGRLCFPHSTILREKIKTHYSLYYQTNQIKFKFYSAGQ